MEEICVYLSFYGGIENGCSKEWEEEKGGGVKGQVQSLQIVCGCSYLSKDM